MSTFGILSRLSDHYNPYEHIIRLLSNQFLGHLMRVAILSSGGKDSAARGGGLCAKDGTL